MPSARTVHHVYIHGVRVSLSHRGRPVPQWLAAAVEKQFAVREPVSSASVASFLRQTFPSGGMCEIEELAPKIVRALRRAASPTQ